MQNRITLVICGLIFLAISISCKWVMPGKSDVRKAQTIDFTTPGKPLDVKVQLDKKHSATETITSSGGSVSLTSADGSKFTLDVPPNALEDETEITMTAVKTIDGAPLDNNSPTAVQLEPSGTFFQELLTLTIVPAKEITIKNQIIFGYEGDGKDYHLAMIDPKSSGIKIKLMEFSGVGVGVGGDAAWAASLQIQAGSPQTRLTQELSKYLQPERRLTGASSADAAKITSALDQFEDQLVVKDIDEKLDCKQAQEALDNMLRLEQSRKWLNLPTTANFSDRLAKLTEIVRKCKVSASIGASYQIVGGLDDWQTNSKVCNVMKPFTLTGAIGITMKLSGGLAGTYTYGGGPFNANGAGTYTISLPGGLGKPGTMTGGGSGQITGDKVYTGTGTEKYTLTPIPPCD